MVSEQQQQQECLQLVNIRLGRDVVNGVLLSTRPLSSTVRLEKNFRWYVAGEEINVPTRSLKRGSRGGTKKKAAVVMKHCVKDAEPGSTPADTELSALVAVALRQQKKDIADKMTAARVEIRSTARSLRLRNKNQKRELRAKWRAELASIGKKKNNQPSRQTCSANYKLAYAALKEELQTISDTVRYELNHVDELVLSKVKQQIISVVTAGDAEQQASPITIASGNYMLAEAIANRDGQMGVFA